MTDPYDDFLEMVLRGNYVILDTETTELDKTAQICQVAVVNHRGDTLLNKLVKPTIPIPAKAISIHGITNEMVADALPWSWVAPQVEAVIKGKNLIIYNAGYDMRLLRQSDKAVGRDVDYYTICRDVWCAMLWYADIWGEWDSYHGNNRWQSLSDAVGQQGLTVSDAHDALGDCRMTWALIQKLCRYEQLPLILFPKD